MPHKDILVRKAAKKAWYERNKEITLKRTKEKRNERNLYSLNYKLNNPFCLDCKVSYPPHVLDFDHVRGVKKAGINQIVRNGTMKQLLEEIEKCELVCSNCHRHRTYMRAVNKKSMV